jgi:hypothetical protein
VIIGLDDGSLDGLGQAASYVSPERAEVVCSARRRGATATGLG